MLPIGIKEYALHPHVALTLTSITFVANTPKYKSIEIKDVNWNKILVGTGKSEYF